MRGCTLAATGIGLLVSASTARGDVVFDFEALAGNDDNRAGDFRVLSLEAGGVYAVVTRTSNERFTVWNSHGVDVPGGWGAKHLSPVFNLFEDDYLVMSFSEPLGWVTIEFGDYGQDHDLAEVWAYDGLHADGALLGLSSGEMGDRDMRWDGPTSVSFAAPAGTEIWSIRFRGGEDPFHQSTFIDNIVVGVIPSPGTLAVLGLGCAAASSRLRRREAR